MSDTYLWDRSGIPDDLERHLEAELRPLGLDINAWADGAFGPPHRYAPQWKWRRYVPLGVAAAVGAVLGAAGWALIASPSGTTAEPEPRPVAAAIPPTPSPPPAGAAGPVEPAPVAPTPVEPAPVEPVPISPPPEVTPVLPPKDPSPALDPYGDDSDTSDSEPDLVDPFGGAAGAPAPSPPIDPFTHRSDSPDARKKLTAREVREVIRRHTSAVRSRCWKSNQRATGAPRTTRVTLTLRIEPSGRVGRVSSKTSGRPVPGLASCVEGQARTWTFPRSQSSMTVSFPFVFAATRSPSLGF